MPTLWPQEHLNCDEEEIGQERKKRIVTSMLSLDTDYWHLTYFSKYNRITRLVAWIFRFVHSLRNQTQKRSGPLTTDVINRAKVFIIKVVQHEAFQDENDKRDLYSQSVL